jgi:hypothetical protein
VWKVPLAVVFEEMDDPVGLVVLVVTQPRCLGEICIGLIEHKMGRFERGRGVGDGDSIGAETTEPSVTVLKSNFECMVINVFVDIEPSECI